MTAVIPQTGRNANGQPAVSRMDVAGAIDAEATRAMAAEAALTTSIVTVASLTAIVASLPTSLPATRGVLWLNGGVLCVS